MQYTRVLACVLSIAVVGCHAFEPKASMNPNYSYEVVDPVEELRLSIREFPNVVEVSLDESRASWERMTMFFKEVLNAKFTTGENTANGQKVVDGSSSHYRYRILRRVNGEQMQYTVQCVALAGGNAGQADLNAKNLARFIRDGQLERLVLVK